MLIAQSRLAPARRPSLLSTLRRMAALHRSRRALARLDAAGLADVGLTAEDARTEASRSPWDAPCNWQQ